MFAAGPAWTQAFSNDDQYLKNTITLLYDQNDYKGVSNCSRKWWMHKS